MTELALNLFHFKITAIPAGFCPFLKENYFPSLKEGYSLYSKNCYYWFLFFPIHFFLFKLKRAQQLQLLESFGGLWKRWPGQVWDNNQPTTITNNKQKPSKKPKQTKQNKTNTKKGKKGRKKSCDAPGVTAIVTQTAAVPRGWWLHWNSLLNQWSSFTNLQQQSWARLCLRNMQCLTAAAGRALR